MNLKKSLLKVLGSNIVTLSAGIVSGLVIPAFLSLDQYAYLKTFTLYLSYVGILHFGLADGLFIKYGGSYEDEVDKSLLKGEHHFFLIFQFIITILIIILSLILEDKILFAFSISIIPFNLLTFYKFFYQAIGKFDTYSKILVFPPLLMLIMNLLIIYIFEIKNYWLFIWIRVLSYSLIFIFLEYNFKRLTNKVDVKFDWNEIKEIFEIGFFIMIGNLALKVFFSIDRWFVKFSFTNSDFAFYSFAISMMTMINLFIGSVTTVFYPYLSRKNDIEILKKLKIYFLILGSMSSGGYFAFSIIVHLFMKKYIPSLNIISIIFAGFPALIILKALYINLYKAKKSDKLYVKTVIIMLLMAIILNFLAVLTVGNNVSIAIATTVSFYIWYYFSSKHFEGLAINLKEVCYLFLFFLLFIFSSNFINLFYGTLIFSIGLIIIITIFFRKEFIDLISEIVSKDTL